MLTIIDPSYIETTMPMKDATVDDLVAEVFELDRTKLTGELTPDDVELWDSMNHLRLVTAIEEAFGIKLLMREVMEMTSISKIREIVAQHLQGR